jgi:serine/threonine-protein kinase HipA
MRKAPLYFKEERAGLLEETDGDFIFTYDKVYREKSESEPISLSLPLQESPYKSHTLFPFFDGLIPEGWLLNIVEKNWKLKERDRMGLLITCCQDCIGAVSVKGIVNED